MKARFFLSILIFGLIVSSYGQKPTLELTFTAENEGQYVPLDSIFIKNLTQHVDTMLYAPDTILVLDYITSISDNEAIGKNSFSVSQNYPNPFNGETTINLYLSEKEHVTITIRGILGIELAQYSNTLNQGNHSFVFYSGNEGYYMFTVTGKHASKTIKMINANSNPTLPTQCQLVYTDYYEAVIKSKSQAALNSFAFNLGDYLRFIGYAKTPDSINGSDVIVDAPQTSELYVLEITKGIPCPGKPTVTYAAKIYNTVLIGSQCWLKENLNVGMRIDSNQSQTNNGYIEKYCYEDDEANCDVYGGLYQWSEMMQYTTQGGTQGICPDGWHIPTDEECKQLEMELGMPECIADWPGWRGTDEGKKLKSSSAWNNNGNGSNSSGFTGLPSGYNGTGVAFGGLGDYGYWWTSSSYDGKAWERALYYGYNKVGRFDIPQSNSRPVRCLKD
jgi:uncharacterized protein (TIGR02145 family)